MSDTPTTNPAPPWRVLMVASPMLIALLLTAAVGALVLSSWFGGEAAGAHAEITWSSDCPEQWVDVARQRAEGIGLGELQVEAEGDRVRLRGVLPGLPDDMEAVPALLTAGGVLQVHPAESTQAPISGDPLVTNTEFADVFFQLDVSGHPFVQVDLEPTAVARLAEADPRALIYTLDGDVVDTWTSARSFKEEHIELHPKLQTTTEEVRMATDWMLMIKYGPGPCEVRGLQAAAVGEG